MNDEILFERDGSLGVIRLNRPKALNALTLDMVRSIQAALDCLAGTDDVRVILLEGAGERAFCAGGDIRAIHDAGRAGDDLPATFWREEYELNAAIAKCAKPVVVLMDGIVMGGGAGLSIHASHRIVTERTRFAMPEVGIGFVPDVGATWRLSRAPGGFGRYLALTGASVGPADVIAADLADAMVESARFPELRSALRLANGPDEIDSAIASLRAEPEPGLFAREGETIAACFGVPSIEGILQSLESLDAEFARQTRDVVLSRSPSSLRDTDALLELALRSSSLEECLLREFWAALGTLRRPDFYEGVRAAVIDKDRAPRWSPPALANVPPSDAAAFAPVDGVVPPFAGPSRN